MTEMAEMAERLRWLRDGYERWRSERCWLAGTLRFFSELAVSWDDCVSVLDWLLLLYALSTRRTLKLKGLIYFLLVAFAHNAN